MMPVNQTVKRPSEFSIDSIVGKETTTIRPVPRLPVVTSSMDIMNHHPTEAMLRSAHPAYAPAPPGLRADGHFLNYMSQLDLRRGHDLLHQHGHVTSLPVGLTLPPGMISPASLPGLGAMHPAAPMSSMAAPGGPLHTPLAHKDPFSVNPFLAAARQNPFLQQRFIGKTYHWPSYFFI